MEREILFRGKRVDNGEWIEGFLSYNIRNELCVQVSFLRNKDGYAVSYIPYSVEQETIGQYIGLKDKNGKKIFEGDSVEITHPCWSNKAIVKFINGSFVFESIDQDTQNVVVPGFTFMREKWKVEIIGNIHDNK